MKGNRNPSLTGQQIVIVGNGIAGNGALSTIRRLNREVTITMISDENLPLYSPCVFHKYLVDEMEKQKLFLKNWEDYSKENVNLILGERVTRVDVQSKEVSIKDKSLSFDKLILATGSKALVPPIRGINQKGVFTLKTMKDADGIFNYPAKSVVVVGSGPIGLEAAIALKKRGLEVYVVEILDRIMPRLFDEEPSSTLRKILEDNGIKVLTREKVVEILGVKNVSSVITDRREIKCDLVIMAAGVRPNVDLARAARLEIGELGGIKTDDYTRTSAEDVYACGDCVESRDIISSQKTLSLLWHNAKRQGEVSGYNCTGKKRKYIGSLDAVDIDIFGIHATSVGKNASHFDNNRSRCDMVEKTYGSSYYRLTIVEDRLVGVQLITKTEDSGLLLSLMLRKDNLKELRDIITNQKLLSVKPWRYRVGHYLKFAAG